MEKTVVTQNNTQVLSAPDTYEYRMETTVSSRGELPFEQIFVYTIMAPDSPVADKFARVATPADLDGVYAVPISRDDAVAAGKTEFLSSYCSLQYPDLTVAAQAKTSMASRINDLIKNWLLYRDQFAVDNGVDQYYPTVDPSVEQMLTDAYVEARDARVEAEAAVAVAETELTLAKKDADTAQKIVDIYKKETEFCQKTHLVDWAALNGQITLALGPTGAYSTFISESKDAYKGLAEHELGHSVTFPPIDADRLLLAAESSFWGDWETAITNAMSALETFNTTGAPAQVAVAAGLLAFCQTAASNYAIAQNTKAAADSDVADAVLNKKEAEATLAAAQAAESAALAKLKEMCPTFNPASV